MPIRPSPSGEPLTEQERDFLWRGIELNNSGAFFLAHEVLEEAWTPCRSGNRRFLQALIHVAVGNYHAHRDNHVGMERQFGKAMTKLKDYPDEYEGVQVRELNASIASAIAGTIGIPGDARVFVRIPSVPKEQDASTTVLGPSPGFPL